jgi:hypothetical protein
MPQKFINYYVRQENHQIFDSLVATLQQRGLCMSDLLNSILPSLQKAVQDSSKPNVIKLENVIQIR